DLARHPHRRCRIGKTPPPRHGRRGGGGGLLAGVGSENVLVREGVNGMGSTHGRSLGLLLERVNDTFKVIAHARGRRIAGGVRFSRPSVAPMPGARPGWSEIVGVI